MSTVNPLLEEAFMFEDMDMMAEMDSMINAIKENGGEIRELTDLDIRKFVLRRKYMLKGIDRLKNLRDAVTDEWDKKIDKETKKLESLESVIHNFVQLRGESIVLDVATVTSRKVGHKVKVLDSEAFIQQLQDAKIYDQFVKTPEPKFSETAARGYLIDTLDAKINAVNEKAKEDIKLREEAYKQEAADLKGPEKKARQSRFAEEKREILLQADAAVHDLIARFKEWIPNSVSYEPESKTLSIRMN